MDTLEMLLDEDNSEPVTLWDENNKEMRFEQVAVIPYDYKIYCILKPIDKIDGVADDEALVFRVDENEDGDTIICVEENEDMAVTIFDQYCDLLEESAKKK